jgi:acetyl esterase
MNFKRCKRLQSKHVIKGVMILLMFINAFNVWSSKISHDFTVTKDVVWTQIDGRDLKMDIYVPNGGQKNYPVIIIYHGGGWLINQKDDMDSLAIYLVSHSNYVVCNVNYRLLGDNNNSTYIPDIIEDAMGAALWIKENIGLYKGDGTKIIVTGDSAGGHLASMVMLCGDDFEADGFGNQKLSFNPTWMPKNQSISQLKQKGGIQVKAAILNYPAIDLVKLCSNGFETALNPFWVLAKKKNRGILNDSLLFENHPTYYGAISPIDQIPMASERVLPPQLCIVGSLDIITPPNYVYGYVERCIERHHTIEYFKYSGRPHAFLSIKYTTGLIINFNRDAPKAIDRMIDFLDSIFYSNN